VLEPRGRRRGGPLEYASWYGQAAIVELLLARGADPAPVMAYGAGSLLRVSYPILRLLVDAGGVPPRETVELMEAARQRDDKP
jgi:ankyrin repeat protein